MFGLKHILRRQLAQRGYVVSKLEPGIPPSLPAFLATIRDRSAAPLVVVCCDHEVRIQTAILGTFPAGQVVFAAPIANAADGLPSPGAVLPPAPSGPFVVVIDLAVFPLDSLLRQLPWLARAATLLLRARPAAFWSGELDLLRLSGDLAKLGFQLADVIDFTCTSPLQAESERLTFVCEQGRSGSNVPAPSRYRVNEALATLSTPVARRADSQLLAGRGSFGFAAGVLNPGAVADGDRVRLLCRTERLPWAVMKTAETHFFTQSPPLVVELDPSQRIVGSTELALQGLPDAGTSRVEDFRMFRYRGELYSNHAVISNPPGRPLTSQPPRLDLMQTRVGISKVDVAGKQLVWQGLPTLDRPLARTEKNWAMFTDGTRLFILYSFSPYILFEARSWPGLEFSKVLETGVAPPFAGDGLALRNSINPVDYDDRHWLHMVHKVYPTKQYAYWAVLIDKATLRPVRASARPLVRGWPSGSAAIIYACSVVVRAADVLLFAGVDDCGTTVTTIPRARLDAEWVELPAAGA